LLILLLGWMGCSEPCLDLCQQYEIYLEECGYGWSTAFEDEGWTTLDDCYDDHWEADAKRQTQCKKTLVETADQACY
jgi:hypothetical protein